MAEAMLALRTLALSEDGRWDRYFNALRAGTIQIPTIRRQLRPRPKSAIAKQKPYAL